MLIPVIVGVVVAVLGFIFIFMGAAVSGRYLRYKTPTLVVAGTSLLWGTAALALVSLILGRGFPLLSVVVATILGVAMNVVGSRPR